LPDLELLPFAGCGDTVPGAAEGEGGSGIGSDISTGMDPGRNIGVVVSEDIRKANELLDCSMESSGEDPSKSPVGSGESILDESGEDSEGSMDTGEKATMDAPQDDGGVYFRVPAGVDNREEDVFMTPAEARGIRLWLRRWGCRWRRRRRRRRSWRGRG
jgi:hypothetical protein